MIQQRNLFAARFLVAAWGNFQEKVFQLIREQHLEQLPMHGFCCVFAPSCCGHGRGLDEAETSARTRYDVSLSHQPQ